MLSLFEASVSFIQDIGNWNTSSVVNMSEVFQNATSFNQNLTQWCVSNFSPEPKLFSAPAPLSNNNKPVWGTCPTTFNINVSASNASDYTLSGTDRNGQVSGNDPTVKIRLEIL